MRRIPGTGIEAVESQKCNGKKSGRNLAGKETRQLQLKPFQMRTMEPVYDQIVNGAAMGKAGAIIYPLKSPRKNQENPPERHRVVIP